MLSAYGQRVSDQYRKADTSVIFWFYGKIFQELRLRASRCGNMKWKISWRNRRNRRNRRLVLNLDCWKNRYEMTYILWGEHKVLILRSPSGKGCGGDEDRVVTHCDFQVEFFFLCFSWFGQPHRTQGDNRGSPSFARCKVVLLIQLNC